MKLVIQPSSHFPESHMHAESRTTFSHSSIIQEPPSKTIEFNDNPLEAGILTPGNEFGREAKREMETYTQTGNYEINTDSLPSEKCDVDGARYASGQDACMALEDTILGAANDTGNIVAAYYNPFETSYKNPFEDDAYFYTDKVVTDIELPELPSCFKDSNFYVVKDICVDMGVPSLDKILEENDGVEQKGIIRLPHSDLDENGDLTKEVAGHTVPVSDGFNLLLCNGQPTSGADQEVANHRSPEKLSAEGGGIADAMDGITSDMHDEKDVPGKLPPEESAEMVPDGLKSLVFDGQKRTILLDGGGDVDLPDGIKNDAAEEKVMPDAAHLVHESEAGNYHADSPSFTRDEDWKQLDQGKVPSAPDGVDVRLWGAREDGHITTLVEPSATEEFNNNARDFPFDRTVESGSITFNFDSSPPVMGSGVVAPGSSDYQDSGRGLNVPILDDGVLDSLTGSTRSFFIQHGLVESSVSGPIAYSGSIPYSGSISLRSDSSTASARSFAFPVLHSEWNSSPVKMAKPDRRHRRKHRGWRAILLCCRF